MYLFQCSVRRQLFFCSFTGSAVDLRNTYRQSWFLSTERFMLGLSRIEVVCSVVGGVVGATPPPPPPDFALLCLALPRSALPCPAIPGSHLFPLTCGAVLALHIPSPSPPRPTDCTLSSSLLLLLLGSPVVLFNYIHFSCILSIAF